MTRFFRSPTFSVLLLIVSVAIAIIIPIAASDTSTDSDVGVVTVGPDADPDSVQLNTTEKSSDKIAAINESITGNNQTSFTVETEITVTQNVTGEGTPAPTIAVPVTTVTENPADRAHETIAVTSEQSTVPTNVKPAAIRAPAQSGHAGTETVPYSPVAMFRGNPWHTGVYSTGGITPVDHFLWQVPVIDPSGEPVVYKGAVYIGNRTGSVYAFSDTGDVKWRTDNIHDCNNPSGNIEGTDSTPLVYNDMVYYHWLGWGNNEHIAILRTSDGTSVDGSCGGSRAGRNPSSSASSSPVLVDETENLVRFGTGDGWIWEGAPNLVSADGIFQADSGIHSSPAFDNYWLFFGSDSGVVYGIDAYAYTNKPMWKYRIGGPVTSPAISGDTVYIGSFDGYLYALDEGSGHVRWKYKMTANIRSSPAIDNGIVYVTDNNGLLSAISTADGSLRWSLSTRSSLSPTIANQVMYLGTTSGEVIALDAATGNRLWSYNAGDSVSSAIVVNNGKLFFTTRSGHLVALGDKSPTSGANIAVFGNTGRITQWPSGTTYSRLGGTAGIRRDGSLDPFTTAPVLTGNDWVQVTNGAAVRTDGSLVTWTPGSTAISSTFRPADTGKKYVAVSQYSDWLLAIYLDSANQTRLETIDNPNAPPAGAVPDGTGWIRISAGNNFALALHSDGTLAAWGKNNYGQLNLPKTTTYRDIEAGEDFSLGLDSTGSIRAAGRNDHGQILDKPAGSGYMAIGAGSGFAAALTSDGYVLPWGKLPVGPEPPLDAGYTDLAFGPDFGFALKENAKEAAVTAPLSPDTTIRATDGSDVTIPFGSEFDHTHNFVTRVFGPDGKEILWAYDRNATMAHFPNGAIVPLSLVHYVPSGSTVNASVPYHAEVISGSTDSGQGETVMTVSEDAWYKEHGGSLPRAMCIAGEGCRVGTSAKQQLFLSDALPGSSSRDAQLDFVPVFSVRQVSNGSWVGTLSNPGSTGTADSVSMIVQKANANPDQQINFSIVSGNWGTTPGTNMWVTAKANLTSGDAGLNYTITATASQVIPAMNVTPQIWKMTEAGDVLVYTGDPVTCSAGMTCVAAGNFAPSDTATYYANATMLYTVPVTTANGVTAGTQLYAVMAASAGATASGNQATNFEGTRDDYPTFDYYKDVVQYAQTKQNGKGYSAEAYLKPTSTTLNSRFPNDYIIFYNGHSEAGRLEIDDTSGSEKWYCATGCPGSQFDDISLSHARMAMFMSCNSGDTSDTYGNLVDKAHDKGATCAFGYTRTLSGYHAPLYYGQKFWETMADGKSWNEAHDAALKYLAKQQPTCTETGNNYCGYGALHKNGGYLDVGCMQAISLSERNSSVHANNAISPDDSNPEIVRQKSVIRDFTGLPDLNLKYVGSDHGYDGDSYEFEADNGLFSVNTRTGRVQSFVFYHPPLSQFLAKEIDLDQAYEIAQKYAKERYPELWETTDQKGVKNTARYRFDHGSGDVDYSVGWNEEYYSSNSTGGNRYTIAGPNEVGIRLFSTGAVKSYHERVISIDPALNLTPDLTEDRAWTIAQDYYASHGAVNVTRRTDRSQELAITSDESHIQRLTWHFDALNNSTPKRGGEIWVDAHKGIIVDYLPVL